MRYFGELKKGTLTLAWTIAERNGFTACHGGQKRFNLPDGKKRLLVSLDFLEVVSQPLHYPTTVVSLKQPCFMMMLSLFPIMMHLRYL